MTLVTRKVMRLSLMVMLKSIGSNLSKQFTQFVMTMAIKTGHPVGEIGWRQRNWEMAALESRLFALLETSTFADLKSNTGQVLRSLYESLEDKSDNTSSSSVQLLNEALQMFEACLMSQEKEMSAFQEQQRAMAEQNQDMEMDDEDGGVSIADSSNSNGEGSSDQVEQW
jgi:hypothetical protein